MSNAFANPDHLDSYEDETSLPCSSTLSSIATTGDMLRRYRAVTPTTGASGSAIEVASWIADQIKIDAGRVSGLADSYRTLDRSGSRFTEDAWMAATLDLPGELDHIKEDELLRQDLEAKRIEAEKGADYISQFGDENDSPAGIDETREYMKHQAAIDTYLRSLRSADAQRISGTTEAAEAKRLSVHIGPNDVATFNAGLYEHAEEFDDAEVQAAARQQGNFLSLALEGNPERTARWIETWKDHDWPTSGGPNPHGYEATLALISANANKTTSTFGIAAWDALEDADAQDIYISGPANQSGGLQNPEDILLRKVFGFDDYVGSDEPNLFAVPLTFGAGSAKVDEHIGTRLMANDGDPDMVSFLESKGGYAAVPYAAIGRVLDGYFASGDEERFIAFATKAGSADVAPEVSRILIRETASFMPTYLDVPRSNADAGQLRDYTAVLIQDEDSLAEYLVVLKQEHGRLVNDALENWDSWTPSRQREHTDQLTQIDQALAQAYSISEDLDYYDGGKGWNTAFNIASAGIVVVSAAAGASFGGGPGAAGGSAAGGYIADKIVGAGRNAVDEDAERAEAAEHKEREEALDFASLDNESASLLQIAKTDGWSSKVNWTSEIGDTKDLAVTMKKAGAGDVYAQTKLNELIRKQDEVVKDVIGQSRYSD